VTTGRPEVGSSRSSRTRDKPPQISTPAVDRRPTCLAHVFHTLLCALDYIIIFFFNTLLKSIFELRWLTCSLYGYIDHSMLPSVLSSTFHSRISPILVNSLSRISLYVTAAIFYLLGGKHGLISTFFVSYLFSSCGFRLCRYQIV
jgi:hypothetical protein